MRLLYVIDSLAPGGAETSLADMAPGLVSQGIDLHVLPLGRRVDLAQEVHDAGGLVHSRVFGGGRLSNIKAVREVAQAIRPDLIHTTLYEADIAGRAAALTLGIPVSTSLVNDSYGPSHYAESERLRLHAARTLDAATAAAVKRFHAITHSIANSVAPRLAIPDEKIEVIPRGRNADIFTYKTEHLRAVTRSKLGISPDAQVVLTAGRLEPQKGQEHLLRAMRRVAANHEDAVLLVAGKDGRASNSLRALAANQTADIRFLGHRNDLGELLAAADVFCFPSDREGFGGVLLEALAVGCPIVASAIPTSLEVLDVKGKPLARFFPIGDDERLGDAILAVLANRDASAARTERGRLHFEAHYTTEAVSKQMTTFFRRAAAAE